MDDFFRVPLWLAARAQAAAFKKSFLGVEAEGLPDAAQGDMVGAEGGPARAGRLAKKRKERAD